MQKQATIQQALKAAFPEFNDKKQLIDYYVSFEYPEKQMKMVNWYQKIIEFIIQHENRVYITYQQLASYLTIYNLKPTPLPNIVNYLAKKDVLAPQNEQEVRTAIRQASNQNKKSFFNTIMAYINKPTEKEESFFKCAGAQKIYSKKIKEFKKNEIRKLLPTIFTEHSKSINLYKLVSLLESKVQLDKDSVHELLKELDKQNTLSVSQNHNQQFVLYSHHQQNLRNKDWVEVQRMKFRLREEIQKFQFMVSKEEEKVGRLKEKAKEQVVSNRKGAFNTCKEIKQREKKIENILTRKHILDNQITQLQYNQMNKTTIDLLEQAQTVYQQTMIDQNKLDELVQKNMEIEIETKQTNQKMEALVSKEDLEQEVDEMLKSLEKEVMKHPEKQKIKVQIPMEIENLPQQSEKMDVETKPLGQISDQYS